MSTFDWPEALVPQTCHMPLTKAGLQFQSPFNGTVQAVDFIAERWTLSASLAQMASRNPRGVGAFMNQLSGGVNRVRAWPFHTKGVPRGTLRGTPTLGTAAARGDLVLTLAGCTATNLLTGGSFEFDTNADGLSDGWSSYSAGTVSGLAFGRNTVTPINGAYRQRVAASNLGTTSADRIGISKTLLGLTGGTTYTLSAYVCWLSASSALAGLYVDWKDAGGTIVGSSSSLATVLSATLTRATLTDAAPATAVRADVYLFAHTRGVAGSAVFELDAVQFEAAAAATAFDGGATLLADDYIGAGGQLLQVASDCAANDAGAMTVPLVNRVRGTIASAAAVTWHKPTAEFMMPAMQAGPVFRPGAIDSAALDLVEVW